MEFAMCSLCWYLADNAVRVFYFVISLSCFRGSFRSGTLQHVLLRWAGFCIATTKIWEHFELYKCTHIKNEIRIFSSWAFVYTFFHKVPCGLATVRRFQKFYRGSRLLRKRNREKYRNLWLLYHANRCDRFLRKRAEQIPWFFIAVPSTPWRPITVEACRANTAISDDCAKQTVAADYGGSVPSK